MKTQVAIFIKFVCLIYLIIGIPYFFSSSEKAKPNSHVSNKLDMWFGLEHLVKSQKDFSIFKSMNFAVLCVPASVDQQNQDSVTVLLKNGFRVKDVFVIQDEDKKDKSSFFAFKKHLEKTMKVSCVAFHTNESFIWSKNIDALILDIQDFGVSGNFIIPLLKSIMKSAQNNHKKIIILDRPNPLGGKIEGSGEIPWRHGLTIGELGYFLNKNILEYPADLSVVPMVGWRRSRALHGLPYMNAASIEFLKTKPFLDVMNEINPFSIESDLNKKEQTVWIPEHKKLSTWELRYLKRLCWKLGLYCNGCVYKDKKLQGLKIGVKGNISKFSEFNSLLTVIRFLKNRKNIELTFSENFDKKLGSSDVRKFLQGEMLFDDLKNKIDQNVLTFYYKAKECLLYKPDIVVGAIELIKG